MRTKESYYRRYTEKRAKREKEYAGDWKNKIKDPLTLFTGILAIGTVALAIVAFLQWGTLEKTDHTLRSGQRGFAYVKAVWWRPYQKEGKLIWWGLVQWENTGNTPINPVHIELMCPTLDGGGELVADPYALKRAPAIIAGMSKVSVELGPKQNKFGGQCTIAPDEFTKIQNQRKTQYIITQATYSDIYGDQHVTRFCERVYLVKGNLSIADPTIEVASIACVRHNCSDHECEKEDAELNLPPERLKP